MGEPLAAHGQLVAALLTAMPEQRASGLFTLLDGPVAADPGRVALIFDGQAVSYGDFEAAAAACAAGLEAAGVRSGWRIPVADDASLLSVATVLGAPLIGASPRS